jgi:hypothetical protein
LKHSDATMVDFDSLVAYFQGNLWATALLVFSVTILFLVAHGIWDSFQKPVILEASPVPCGDITIDELSKFDGGDPFKPIYFAVRGKVYDVTKGREFYGSGEFYFKIENATRKFPSLPLASSMSKSSHIPFLNCACTISDSQHPCQVPSAFRLYFPASHWRQTCSRSSDVC